jgi:simple sugar transport system ATP-binding protein
MGILLISEDLDELRALADTILVMFEGRIVGEVHPDEFDPEIIGLMMAGLSGSETR